MQMKQVAIFTDSPGWHGEALKNAFLKQGIDAIFVSLNACALQLNDNQETQLACPLLIPGFHHSMPQAVFVRGVSGGSLQQVITRLNILHMLERLGVMVYNAPRAIERTVDKAMTSFLLSQHHVNTPQTWVCESRQLIEKIRTQFPQTTFVLKPIFGSQGIGVRLLAPNSVLPVPMAQFVEGVYYLQAFIPSKNCSSNKQGASIDSPNKSYDFRVFVVGGRVIAAMRRSGHDWIHNVAAGAICEAISPSVALSDIALAAAKAVDINYCGVDIIEASDGRLYVLEVNSIPAWRGLQGVAEVDIATSLVDDFLLSAQALMNEQP